MEAFAIVMVFLGIPTILGWMYRSHLSHQRHMKVLQLKAEMNARLLDKLGNEPGILDVLRSDAQQKMFDLQIPENGGRLSLPYARMLTAGQAGIVMVSAGAGLLYIRQFLENVRDQTPLLVFGTLGVSIGVGALLSAIAAFMAAKMWQVGQDA